MRGDPDNSPDALSVIATAARSVNLSVMPDEVPYDVFLSYSAKDKAVVRAFSLSASNGERAGVRCRNPPRHSHP